jgi:hypothetical protein
VLPPPGRDRARVARNEKSIEVTIAIVSLILTMLLMACSFLLFISTKSDESLRWVSSVLDRFSTGFLVQVSHFSIE